MINPLVFKVIALLFHISSHDADIQYLDIITEGVVSAKYVCTYEDDVLVLTDSFNADAVPGIEFEQSDLYSHVYTVHPEGLSSLGVDIGELLIQIPDSSGVDISFTSDDTAFDIYATNNGLIASIPDTNQILILRW